MQREIQLARDGCVLKVEVRLLTPETALEALVERDIDAAHLQGLLVNGYRVLCAAFGLGDPGEDA
jgi:hypothetical protein